MFGIPFRKRERQERKAGNSIAFYGERRRGSLRKQGAAGGNFSEIL
jgi:hypothetical protein